MLSHLIPTTSFKPLSPIPPQYNNSDKGLSNVGFHKPLGRGVLTSVHTSTPCRIAAGKFRLI